MKAENYLSDLEKKAVERFNSDIVMKNAVKKVLLEPVYLQGTLSPGAEPTPSKNFMLTPVFNMLMGKRENWDNEKLGEWTRANAMAIQFIEGGFGELEKFKANSTEEEKKTENPAL